uniref:Protein kinase domain-containing protein n=1 Tax=Aegilops tauschii subsp. strangulata TaxID=200361 RepID=A0A453TDN7_AEGTS
NTYMREKEFHREVECLIKAKHRNVVRFLGYCVDTQGNMASYNGKMVMADVHQRFLCFGYLPNGSLDVHITGNILLDEDMMPKITDFGLSRCFDDDQTRVITRDIGGTLGYLAPEFTNYEITHKFGLYGLGVIIMEMLTGKKGYHTVENVFLKVGVIIYWIYQSVHKYRYALRLQLSALRLTQPKDQQV